MSIATPRQLFQIDTAFPLVVMPNAALDKKRLDYFLCWRAASAAAACRFNCSRRARHLDSSFQAFAARQKRRINAVENVAASGCVPRFNRESRDVPRFFCLIPTAVRAIGQDARPRMSTPVGAQRVQNIVRRVFSGQFAREVQSDNEMIDIAHHFADAVLVQSLDVGHDWNAAMAREVRRFGSRRAACVIDKQHLARANQWFRNEFDGEIDNAVTG